MAQHIRNKPENKPVMGQHIRQMPNGKEDFKHMISSQMQRIRSSPKMMFGTILLIILFVVLALAALHYFRVITLPITFMPQKGFPAPASHLQYFFF